MVARKEPKVLESLSCRDLWVWFLSNVVDYKFMHSRSVNISQEFYQAGLRGML